MFKNELPKELFLTFTFLSDFLVTLYARFLFKSNLRFRLSQSVT